MKYKACAIAALSRRRFLTTLIGATCAVRSRAFAHTIDMQPHASARPPTRLLVSGAETTDIGKFATMVAPTLSSSLSLAEALILKFDLGHDGVTAANLFDRNTPDDNTETAIFSKGLAIIAAQCDDPRVHFDYSRWIGVFVTQQPVATIARADLHRTFRTRVSGLLHDKPLRVAVTQPIGVELPSVLGLSLLGFHPIPVSGLASPHKAMQALASGAVDAMQFTITNDADRAMLKQLPEGTAPLFNFGEALPDVRRFEHAYAAAQGRAPVSQLYHGWHALAAAAATPLLLGLPMLTPPVSVARWRYAAKSLLTDDGFKSWLNQHAMTAEAGIAASDGMARFTPELTALLALRRWLNLNLPRWRLGQESKRLF